MKSITKTMKKEVYIAPVIEVVEIEIEQNILQSASGESTQGDDPDMGNQYW